MNSSSNMLPVFKKATLIIEKESLQLLRYFAGEDLLPYEREVKRYAGAGKVLIIQDLVTCQEYLNQVYKDLKEMCRAIDPSVAVPVLLQTISEYYYGLNKLDPIWLGLAAKRILALIWGNLYQVKKKLRYSTEMLKKALILSGFLDQFAFLEQVYSWFGANGKVTISGRGMIIESPEIQLASQEYQAIFEKRGKTFRIANHEIQELLWGRSKELYEAIAQVIIGKEPHDQAVFKDTVFSVVSKDNLDFWLELFMRVALWEEANLAKSRVEKSRYWDSPIGIAFVEPKKLLIPSQILDKMESAGKRSFWNLEWYQSQIKNTPVINMMIVERPAMRIMHEYEFFATSPMLITDSLHWFLECSIMSYDHSGAIPLPENVKQFIGKRFEKEVCAILRKLGFIAGRVNEKGVWFIAPGKHLQLVHSERNKNPGEIDCLAYHPNASLCLLIECKLLNIPYNARAVQNLYSKLEMDSEGYRKKLLTKSEWLAESNLEQVIDLLGMEHAEDIYLDRFIVVDRYLPGMIQNQDTILHIDDLVNSITAHLNKPRRSNTFSPTDRINFLS